jgi:hypothetical protein
VPRPLHSTDEAFCALSRFPDVNAVVADAAAAAAPTRLVGDAYGTLLYLFFTEFVALTHGVGGVSCPDCLTTTSEFEEAVATSTKAWGEVVAVTRGLI